MVYFIPLYQDEESLFSVLSAILLLGDLNFACQENSEAAILTNPDVADKAGEMLHIPGDEIVGAILSETTYTRGEKNGIIGKGYNFAYL